MAPSLSSKKAVPIGTKRASVVWHLNVTRGHLWQPITVTSLSVTIQQLQWHPMPCSSCNEEASGLSCLLPFQPHLVNPPSAQDENKFKPEGHFTERIPPPMSISFLYLLLNTRCIKNTRVLQGMIRPSPDGNTVLLGLTWNVNCYRDPIITIKLILM